METRIFSLFERIHTRIQTIGEVVNSLANEMRTNLALDMAEFRRKRGH